LFVFLKKWFDCLLLNFTSNFLHYWVIAW
jgi:hypothetical protein